MVSLNLSGEVSGEGGLSTECKILCNLVVVVVVVVDIFYLQHMIILYV